jgi:tetratricopeptide (TPR) repeat protein
MPIDLKRVQDVFQAVAELSPAEREAMLEQASGGDAELRRRVGALLKAHDESAELPSPDLTDAYTPLPAVEPGQVFAGRYKLREKLGEGGMGAVFVADQIAPVQRRVAIKVIRSGLDSERLLARFEQERQALALMDHPNIAKVLDAGIDLARRPYFAMELVKGLPLTKYCDDARLSARQRIELFVPVCRAVQHAHQKGIIHRDLKPSNILVGLYDGRAVPKVIDFGVAKATGPRLTEQSIYTELGSLIGTLEYMSPEQAELNNLDIDTRSDVYALGVILYELLTGTVPFSRKELEKAGLAEMLRVIKEVEPHRPSTRLSGSGTLPSIAANRQTEPKKLTALVRGELDWIVMKALEKDRGRRYETANGLALDVQRYLEGEPVLAAPASAAYRLKKLVIRNKRAVLAASLVLLALMAGVAGTTWGLLRANRERRIAESNATKANLAATAEKQAKERALANFTLARESVEKYLGTVTDDPELKNADFHKLRKKLLESALPFFQRIAEQKNDDPEVEAGRGRAYYRLGGVLAALGENESSVADYESMRAIFGRLAAEFPAVPEYSQALAHSHNGLGTVFAALGKSSEAEAAYRYALSIQEKLAADFPAVPQYRRYLANSQYNLGFLLAKLGKRGQAEAAFRHALVIQERLAAEFPAVPTYRRDLAYTQIDLGALLANLGKHGDAEAAFRHALAVGEKLAGEFPAVPEYRQCLADSHRSLSAFLADLGKGDEAEAAARHALAFKEKLAADFPTVPRYRAELAISHQQLGFVVANLGNFGEAEVAYRHAVGIQEKLAADFPSVTEYRRALAVSHNSLGVLLANLGKRGQAEATYRRALTVREKLARDFPTVPAYVVELGGSFCNMGNLILNSGQPEAALTWYQKAIERLGPVVAQEPRLVQARQFLRNSYWNRANALDALGRHAEATRDWKDALKLDDGSAKQRLQSGLIGSRLRMFRKDKDSSGCLAAAAECEGLKHADPGGLYDAACFRAICAAVIRADPKTPAADAARLAKEQADLAMAWLRKAVAAGFKDAEHMMNDTDLDALREIPEFKALLAELTTGKAPGKK